MEKSCEGGSARDLGVDAFGSRSLGYRHGCAGRWEYAVTPEEEFQALCEACVAYVSAQAKRMAEIIAVAAIETEREECAKIVDRTIVDFEGHIPNLYHVARAIRARGKVDA